MPVMGQDDPKMLLCHLMWADEFGVKLKAEGFTQRWKIFPSPLHQDEVMQIYSGVRRALGSNSEGCDCYRLVDAYIQFPDGSLKRPDLALFCRRPEVRREALEAVPQAIAEVLSRGTEAKDLVTGPRIYLASGVLDVVALHPETGMVTQIPPDGTRILNAPVEIELAMGSVVTI